MNTVTFKDLGLSAVLLDALEQKGYEFPTPIQVQTIPLMLSDEKDIIGQAQTGTGKTAAFGLPILEKISENQDHIQALILTPTRELTLQITEELKGLMGKKRLTVTAIYGGQSIDRQRQELRSKVDIVVGTPGRLIDHLKSKNLNLSKIKFLVLDEADEMLTDGFKEEVEEILSRVNTDRKTLLFSATMPQDILRLAETYMKEYTMVKTKRETMNESLTEQFYYEVREADKLEALCRIIDVVADFYGFIFCRTKRDVDLISEKLVQRGYNAEAMHGDLSQHQRERVLQKFRKKHCNILVVTDVASRGIDVKGLTHVINFAIPQDPESYVHRVGRTGRAGKTGTAITLVSPSEFRKLKFIQKLSNKDIIRATIPTVHEIVEAKKARFKQSLTDAIQLNTSNGNTYNELAKEILVDNTPEDVISALLHLAFANELSKESYKEIRDSGKSDKRPDRNDRYERNDRNDRSERRDRNDRPERRDRNQNDDRFTATGDMVRLFIAKGKLDDMTPRSLVAFIENKTGVFGKKIQGVQIYDKFSFVNASKRDADQIISGFYAPGKRSIVEIAK